MTGRVNRRLAAIMAIDVVGYSRLMGADEVGVLDSRIEGGLVALTGSGGDAINLARSELGNLIARTGRGRSPGPLRFSKRLKIRL